MQDARDPGQAMPLGWISAGGLRMEPVSGRVTVRGREVPLTEMERRVLLLLLGAGGKPMSRDAMLAGLYPPSAAPEPRVVDVFVCRLRAKLARAGLYCVIGTVWRRGYVLRLSEAAGREDTLLRVA